MSTILPYSLKMCSRSCLLEVGFMFPQKMFAASWTEGRGEGGANPSAAGSMSSVYLRFEADSTKRLVLHTSSSCLFQYEELSWFFYKTSSNLGLVYPDLLVFVFCTVNWKKNTGVPFFGIFSSGTSFSILCSGGLVKKA